MDYDMVEYLVEIVREHQRTSGELQEGDAAYCDEIIEHLKGIQIMAG